MRDGFLSVGNGFLEKGEANTYRMAKLCWRGSRVRTPDMGEVSREVRCLHIYFPRNIELFPIASGIWRKVYLLNL